MTAYWMIGLLRQQYPEMSEERIGKLIARWGNERRIPCPECGNGTPIESVFAKRKCPFGHPMTPVVLEGA